MVRFALATLAVGVWIVLTNNDFFRPVSLEDKLALVALLPGAFLLGMSLLKD